MRSKAYLVLAMFVLGTQLCVAQVTTGTITGTVMDSSGAVLPGAKIDITNEGTGTTRSALSGADGHYSVPLLPVGKYKIAASMEGFQTEVRSGVELTIGREELVDIKLQVGAVSQTVEVTGEAPLVQTTEATVSFLVADQTMRDLPLNGRDMSQLILLNPGVTETETLGGSVQNGYGRRISISGARGEDNVYLLDGALIGDYRRHIPAGPSGSLLGVESVQEFQVLTTDIPAQYGRVLGGVFNSVSKSGTNQFHGDAYEFLRNDNLDAARWEDNAFGNGFKRPLRRNQFGATFGGPIKKDKVFFFAGYEGTRERLSSIVTQRVLDNNARLGIFPTGPSITPSPLVAPYLAWYPLATPGALNHGDGTQDFVWTYDQPTTEDFGQARIDLPALSANDSMFFRFTGSAASQDARSGFPGEVQASSLRSRLLTLSETHIYSPTLLNTVRFHFSRVIPFDDGREPPSCAVANVTLCTPVGVVFSPGQSASPMLTPGVLSSIGGGGYATKPSLHISNRFTYQDDANWTKGSHALQFGGMVERFQYNNNRSSRAFGVWTWPSAQLFLAGTCGNVPAGITLPTQCTAPGATPDTTTESLFRGTPVGSSIYPRGFRQSFFAMYIQDNWRVSRKLTLNMGVRWEPYTVPTEVNGLIANMRNIFYPNVSSVTSPYWLNKSWTDFGPRFGFAYDPFGTGKTAVRGGFGLLYEPNDPNEYYNQMANAPPLAFDFQVPGTGHFPNDLPEIAGQNTLGQAYVVEYGNNKSPHLMQYSFSVQQQLGTSNLVSAGYVGSRGNDLIGIQEQDTPVPFYDGVSYAVPVGARQPNPNYTLINYFGPFGDSWYNSLQLSYQRRFSHGLQTQVSYTWEKSESTADTAQQSNVVNSGGLYGVNPWDLRTFKGLSGYDIPQTLKINYSYDLPSLHGTGMMGSKVLGQILSGWQTTGVLTLHSGHPGTLSVGVLTPLSNAGVQVRVPNAAPNFTGPIVLGTPSDGKPTYFNINAYQYNVATGLGAQELGNLGRNTLIGPGLVQWDPALFKTFAVTERTKMEFRAEFFNMLNRPNYSFPAASLATASGAFNTTAGTITTTSGTSRQIQFALKLLF